MNKTHSSVYQIVVIFVVLLATCLGALSQEGSGEVDLTSRPGPAGKKTVVNLSIKVLDVDEIDGASQTFTANVVVVARWKDKRLVGGSKRRTLALSEVWNPVMQITNQQRLMKTFPDVVQVEADGTVEWAQRYWGRFSNPLNLQEFPLDKHTFVVQLVVASVDFKEVELRELEDEGDRSGLADKLSLPDWEVTGWRVNVAPVELIKESSPLPGMAFEFEASRYLGYYLTKVLLPLLMIVMMSWIVFWIHPSESATQISVSITSMLTLIAYRFALGAMLPDVSYLTRMDGFILVSTVMVFGALLEAVVTSRLADTGKEELAIRIDNVCQKLFPGAFALLCVYAAWG